MHFEKQENNLNFGHMVHIILTVCLSFFRSFCGAEEHQHVALCVRFVCMFRCVQLNFRPILGKVGG